MRRIEVEDDVFGLYQTRIRELASSVRADRRLRKPDGTITRRSLVCGSVVTLDVTLTGDAVLAIGYRARACTLGMAATAILCKAALGSKRIETDAVADKLRSLLSGGEPEFPKPWSDLLIFRTARRFPSRHGSILLPFDALSEAWDIADSFPGRGSDTRRSKA